MAKTTTLTVMVLMAAGNSFSQTVWNEYYGRQQQGQQQTQAQVRKPVSGTPQEGAACGQDGNGNARVMHREVYRDNNGRTNSDWTCLSAAERAAASQYMQAPPESLPNNNPPQYQPAPMNQPQPVYQQPTYEQPYPQQQSGVIPQASRLMQAIPQTPGRLGRALQTIQQAGQVYRAR